MKETDKYSLGLGRSQVGRKEKLKHRMQREDTLPAQAGTWAPGGRERMGSPEIQKHWKGAGMGGADSSPLDLTGHHRSCGHPGYTIRNRKHFIPQSHKSHRSRMQR